MMDMDQKLLATITFSTSLLLGGSIASADTIHSQNELNSASNSSKLGNASDYFEKTDNCSKSDKSMSRMTASSNDSKRNLTIKGENVSKRPNSQFNSKQFKIDSSKCKVHPLENKQEPNKEHHNKKLLSTDNSKRKQNSPTNQNRVKQERQNLNHINQQIAYKENQLHKKQQELTHLDTKQSNNSVMRSLVNDSRVGVNTPFYIGHITPDNKSTEKTNQYYKQCKNNDIWYIKNQNKESISNKKLTFEQAWELNLYLIDKLNITRKTLGQQPFIASKEAFEKVVMRANLAQNNFCHDRSDISISIGDDWISENLGLGTMRKTSDYASVITEAILSIDTMLNNDADSHWGHRNNFLQDYKKLGWTTPVQAAFGFTWSNKYNAWIMVFDVMRYHKEKDQRNSIYQIYPNNSIQSQLNQSISTLQDQILVLQNQAKKIKHLIQCLQNHEEKECSASDLYCKDLEKNQYQESIPILFKNSNKFKQQNHNSKLIWLSPKGKSSYSPFPKGDLATLPYNYLCHQNRDDSKLLDRQQTDYSNELAYNEAINQINLYKGYTNSNDRNASLQLSISQKNNTLKFDRKMRSDKLKSGTISNGIHPFKRMPLSTCMHRLYSKLPDIGGADDHGLVIAGSVLIALGTILTILMTCYRQDND